MLTPNVYSTQAYLIKIMCFLNKLYLSYYISGSTLLRDFSSYHSNSCVAHFWTRQDSNPSQLRAMSAVLYSLEV